MSYREKVAEMNMLAESLHDAKYDFDEEKATKLQAKMSKLSEEMKEIELFVEKFSPEDIAPYKGDSFRLERLCLKSVYICGYSYERTAEIMNISRSTVCRIVKYMQTAAEEVPILPQIDEAPQADESMLHPTTRRALRLKRLRQKRYYVKKLMSM